MTTRPVVAALHTLGRGADRARFQAPSGLPFVTITRQAWAGGLRLAEQLVQRFNATDLDPTWECYDREIIEQVATDHDLPDEVIEQMLERPRSWLEDIASGLRYDQAHPTDEVVYAKVVATIRALAERGHAVFIGRGAAYCTQDLATGVHIRLTAPLADRVERAAAERGLSPARAERLVRQTDDQRLAFIKRFWPSAQATDDLFALTLNTSRIPADAQACMVSMLVAARQACIK